VRLVATGVAYRFDWPGAPRSLEGLTFERNADYWAYERAYENTDDYVDRLEIILESRSDQLRVSQSGECALLFKQNKTVIRSPCRPGETPPVAALTTCGGALIAEFQNLKPDAQ
jgi:hypothetical protein